MPWIWQQEEMKSVFLFIYAEFWVMLDKQFDK